MVLKAPFGISSRLLPSVKIGDGTLSLEHVGNADNRMVYRWYLDMDDGREFSDADLKSGCQDVDSGATTQAMFGSLLSFLGAAAEGYSYTMRTRRESENGNLFPAPVVEWAYQHADELSSLQCEIEESGTALITA